MFYVYCSYLYVHPFGITEIFIQNYLKDLFLNATFHDMYFFCKLMKINIAAMSVIFFCLKIV